MLLISIIIVKILLIPCFIAELLKFVYIFMKPLHATDHFEDLPKEDRNQLLKFPVYVSLLACLRDSGMDATEKRSAVRLTHVKTFASPFRLLDFYRQAETCFEDNLKNLENELPKDRAQRETAIHRELEKLEAILKKLSPGYAAELHESLRSYARYVSHAHNNVLEYFIFPMPIKGLSD
jgi:hypothetical protein